jgi:Transposase, Mutator family
MSFDRELRQVCAARFGASGQVSPAAALPEDGVDTLVALLRESARSLIVEAIAAELRHFQGPVAQPGAARGWNAVVRNGMHPQRMIVTGIGRVPVRLPKLRSRTGSAAAFRSALVPRYARRARRPNAESAESYLRALAAGELEGALAALLGPQALAVPAPVTRALRPWWSEQCGVWRHGPPPPPGIPHEFWSELARRSTEAPRNGRYGAYDAVGRAVVGTGSADAARHGVRRSTYTKIDPTSPSDNSRSDAGPFGEGD